jgi:hypothetical protein
MSAVTAARVNHRGFARKDVLRYAERVGDRGTLESAGPIVHSTLGYAAVGDDIVYVAAPVAPAAHDWASYLAYLRATGLPNARTVALVIDPGPGPTAAQRRELLAAMGEFDPKSAVLLSSIFARGVITALSWFKRGFHAFGPNDLELALRFLGIDGARADVVRRCVAEIQRELSRRQLDSTAARS